MNADVRDLLLSIEATAGWETRPASKGRTKVCAPGGGSIVVHHTPSDHRSIKNVRARLRRMGWEAPTNGKHAKSKQPPPPPQETPAMNTDPVPVPDFRLEWALAPDGPPDQNRGRPNPLIDVYHLDAAPVPAAPKPKPNDGGRGMRSSAKLRATSFDDLIEEVPPTKRAPAVEATRRAAEQLVLDLATERPGRWHKLPDLTTPNAAGYMKAAGDLLGVDVTTRFVRADPGPGGWLYVRASERGGVDGR